MDLGNLHPLPSLSPLPSSRHRLLAFRSYPIDIRCECTAHFKLSNKLLPLLLFGWTKTIVRLRDDMGPFPSARPEPTFTVAAVVVRKAHSFSRRRQLVATADDSAE